MEHQMVFDYLFREVSAQSGEGVFEALTEFSKFLHDYYYQKKINRANYRVILLSL